jgi:polyphosphate kinase 2 (PPK2 family)
MPIFERAVTDSGIQLIKYWLDVDMDEQELRFRDRIEDPRKIWKLSPMDVESFQKWYEYSRARDDMLTATDHDYAPWYVVDSNHKHRARLNLISHLLSQLDYEEVAEPEVELGQRRTEGAYDDTASLQGRKFVPLKY